MPETPVHKHRQLQLREYEIRFAENGLIPTPAGYAVSAEDRGQRKLGILVPASANTRHDF